MRLRRAIWYVGTGARLGSVRAGNCRGAASPTAIRISCRVALPSADWRDESKGDNQPRVKDDIRRLRSTTSWARAVPHLAYVWERLREMEQAS